jgi:hypothetical protein
LAFAAIRAMLTMKRGLMPYSQAGMHLPLLVQTCAQRSASLVPSLPASRSSTPPTMSTASAGSSPAGSTIGQAATHLPQRVQASRMSLTLPCRASKNEMPPASARVMLTS